MMETQETAEAQRSREAARRAIRQGLMPLDEPAARWGGAGSGQPCSVCLEPLDHSGVELELLYHRAALGGDVSYHVHVACYAAWQFEAQVFRRPPLEIRSAAAAQGSEKILNREMHDGKIRADEREDEP